MTEPSVVCSSRTIKVGTRASPLALIQTNEVLRKLGSGLKFEIVPIQTTGDKVRDRPLQEIGATAVFTKELEQALVGGEVDIIVHSLKDIESKRPDGCVIGAVIERADPNDVIVIKKSLVGRLKPADLLNATSGPYAVGTSSPRRIALAKHCNPTIECIDIRGNVGTRLSKLDQEEGDNVKLDALILARAGLERMASSDRISATLSADFSSDWLYAPGQGAIAVECRSGDKIILDTLSPIVDTRTTCEVIAERSLMKKLAGGCWSTLGVRTKWSTDQGSMTLEAVVLYIDGQDIHRESSSVNFDDNDMVDYKASTGIFYSDAIMSPELMRKFGKCEKLGECVANKLISSGCEEVMQKLKLLYEQKQQKRQERFC